MLINKRESQKAFPMIFTVDPSYRNCPTCGKKVAYYSEDDIQAILNKMLNRPLTHCSNCGRAFPTENTAMIQAVITQCATRIEQPQDQNRIHFSKFYPAFGAFHHIYAIPLFTLEELLTVENLMHYGHYQGTSNLWIASFIPAHQFRHGNDMSLLSWSPLCWNPEREIFFADADEGPRKITYTPFE